MTDLLRGDLGFEGVTISDALDMAGARPGSRPGRSTSSRRCGPASTCCSRAADPAALGADRADARPRGRRAGCSTRPRWPPRNVVWPRSGRGSASAGAAPDLAVVGGAEHRALAAELAARSITLVRDPAGAPAGPLGRGPPRPGRHAPTRRPDPGRHLVDGRARPRGRPAPLPCATWTRSSSSPNPTRPTIAAVRDRARRRGPRRSSAPSTAIGCRPSSTSSRRSRDRHADDRRRAARAVGRRGLPGWRHRPGDLLDPARLARRAGRGPRRRGQAGPRSPAGRVVAASAVVRAPRRR